MTAILSESLIDCYTKVATVELHHVIGTIYSYRHLPKHFVNLRLNPSGDGQTDIYLFNGAIDWDVCFESDDGRIQLAPQYQESSTVAAPLPHELSIAINAAAPTEEPKAKRKRATKAEVAAREEAARLAAIAAAEVVEPPAIIDDEEKLEDDADFEEEDEELGVEKELEDEDGEEPAGSANPTVSKAGNSFRPFPTPPVFSGAGSVA
jgi:hypothetical protein